MFVYKTKSEFEAMSEYQQEKYLDEKAKHEAKLSADAAKKAADDAVKSAVETVKTELTAVIDGQNIEIAALKVTVDEVDRKREEASAEMSRIKAREAENNIKGIRSEIEQFLTEKDGEGRKQVQEYLKSKKPISLDLKNNTSFKAVGIMSVQSGTTEPQIVSSIAIPHELVQARNIIPVYPTTKDTIKYVQFTKKEGEIGSVRAGQLKPQLDYNSAPKTAPVIKIAGWVTVQDEFLEDVDGAGAFLASELPMAYMDEETRQVFKGEGAPAQGSQDPEELTGLYSEVATDQELPMGTVTSASNNWDKIAAALTQTRRNLRPGDAVWLSPEDYMELMINKGNTAEYTYPIVSDINGVMRMAGIPIYFHTVFLPGEGLAGNYARGVALFQKKGITLRTSTEHDQNFTKNLTTFLIEARVAMPVYYPESFVKVDFNATT